jgi:hypothetical protein
LEPPEGNDADTEDAVGHGQVAGGSDGAKAKKKKGNAVRSQTQRIQQEALRVALQTYLS